MIYARQYLGVFSESSEQWNCLEHGEQVVAFGIQAREGTNFYLNDSQENPIVIGQTGIYELDLRNNSGTITKITVNNARLKAPEDADTHILIDILYSDETGDIPTSEIEEAEIS